MVTSHLLAQTLIQLSEEHGVDKALDMTKAFLAKTNQQGLLEQAKRYIRYYAEQDEKHNSISIKTALELSDSQIKELRNILDADETTNVHQTVDQKLVAGFVATYKGLKTDTSLQTIINNIY
jgi:F0F1-type ATP synthase delta subunit